jgi:hypothetical protein
MRFSARDSRVVGGADTGGGTPDALFGARFSGRGWGGHGRKHTRCAARRTDAWVVGSPAAGGGTPEALLGARLSARGLGGIPGGRMLPDVHGTIDPITAGAGESRARAWVPPPNGTR